MGLAADFPENHGLSSKALLTFFSQIEQLKLGVNSFMLLQNGKVTAQFWRPPYRPDHPQLLYSLSKSFTSIAVGIAWDHGLLHLDDKVISFFPEMLPVRVSANLAKMSVHHLLSMTAGHRDNIYAAVAREQDWAKAYLALDVEHEPGSRYRYCTHSTYMLSAILRQVTGQNLVDFLMPRLFEPLGIPRPSWETCPLGITAGGMGLSLPTEGIAKFGLMLLNQGVYDGQRIVSEQYIKLAAAEQSDNRAGAARIDSAQGYGYQFHLCRRGCYRGDGAFGQLCFVAPKEKLVIAATSSFSNMKLLQTLLDLIYVHILDQLDHNASCNFEYSKELQNQLAAMPGAIPEFKPLPKSVPFGKASSYTLRENLHGLRKITLSARGEELELQVFYGDDRDNVLPFSLTQSKRAYDVFHKDISMQLQEVITFAAWQDEQTLQLALFYIETPYVVTYTITFHEQTIDFRFTINVSLNIPEYRVTGTRCDLS